MKQSRNFLSRVWISAVVGLIGLVCGMDRVHAVTAVATTTHVQDLIRNVGGAEVTMIALMGPGVDPHLYKPSAADVGKLQKADIIFYSGLMLEGRMADIFAKMSRRGAKVYAVTEKMPEDQLLEPEEFEGHWDPHVWFDPALWITSIDVVVEGLSAVDKKNAALYSERGKKLKAEYTAIAEWAKERLSALKSGNRLLVTSHDAFNYFGRAFDLKVVAVQGISTVTEAGLADIASMVDLIKSKKLKAIFIESSVSPAAIERISKDSGAKIGGELFSDAMGAPGHMETGPDGEKYDTGTWPGMMKHNVNTIVQALK